MISRLLIAWCLMAVCVGIQAVGLTAALLWTRRRLPADGARFWQATFHLIGIAGWCVLLHLIQIAAWAFVYAWKDALPDLQTALYFSAATYTTTGYGDLVLPEGWRLIGGIESLTGILMCGLSTALFFAVFARSTTLRSTGNTFDQ